MSQYQKRPVIVDAEQFSYDGPPVRGVFYPSISPDGRTYEGDAFVVTMHNQRVYLQSGDWVIAEPDGEHFYPCKDDVFRATYRPVSESPDTFDAEKAQRAEELAAQCLSDLCHARRRWEMHIPVQDDDPDVILYDALAQLRSAIKEIERHRAELAAIPWDAIEKMQGCEAHTYDTELAKVQVHNWTHGHRPRTPNIVP